MGSNTRVVRDSSVSERVQDCSKGEREIVHTGAETVRQHPGARCEESVGDTKESAGPEENEKHPTDEPALKQEMAPQSAVSGSERKVSQAAKAMEKINAAQQALKQQQNVASPSAKLGWKALYM